MLQLACNPSFSIVIDWDSSGLPGTPGPFRLQDSSLEADIRASAPRVLVVDDERLIADSCAEILYGAGFHAMAAYDGPSAMALAAHYKPTYVITDILMPGMNGVELAIAIRGAMPSVKVLLFSGQVGISRLLEQAKTQGYDFQLLAKPAHPLRLIERLRDMMD